jgi:hypothetical protein
MSCQRKRNPRPMSHRFLLVAGVAAAWFGQSAIAGCPQGYLPKAGHCIPGPAQPHHPPLSESTLHAPVAVVDASRSHALNAQPLPRSKAALNPQPIPPGHLLRKSSPPPAPVGQTPHWDLKKNKGS